jgi:Mrp family chromosome partitioning ATPase
VLSAAEAVPVAAWADAVVMVVKSQVTASADLEDAYHLLERARANILGTVVTDVKGLSRSRTSRVETKRALRAA